MFQSNNYIAKRLLVITGTFLFLSSLILLFSNQEIFQKYPLISSQIAKINIELVNNNSFQNMDGWNYTESNLYGGDGITSSVSNPVSSLIGPIDEKQFYKYSLSASCLKSTDKSKGRLQLIWLSKDSDTLKSEIELFECTAKEKEHFMITESPANANYVIVFASGHSEDKIIFKSASLVKVRPDPNEDLLKLFGLINLSISIGIIFMAYKGLDQGFYIFSIPFIFLHIIWIIVLLSNYLSNDHFLFKDILKNFLVLSFWIILLFALIISRIKSGLSFGIKSLDKAPGINDIVSKNLIILSIILLTLGFLNYIFDPGGFIARTPFISTNEQPQIVALFIKLITSMFLVTLFFMYRNGLSGTLLVMSEFISTIFLLYLIFNLTPNFYNENMYLILYVFLYFIINTILFFRNLNLVIR